MNTIIEELEVKTSGQAAPRSEQARQVAVKAVRSGNTPATTAQEHAEGYTSCLELAALFIARG